MPLVCRLSLHPLIKLINKFSVSFLSGYFSLLWGNYLWDTSSYKPASLTNKKQLKHTYFCTHIHFYVIYIHVYAYIREQNSGLWWNVAQPYCVMTNVASEFQFHLNQVYTSVRIGDALLNPAVQVQNIAIRLHQYKGLVSFVRGSLALGLTEAFIRLRHSIPSSIPTPPSRHSSSIVALEIHVVVTLYLLP